MGHSSLHSPARIHLVLPQADIYLKIFPCACIIKEILIPKLSVRYRFSRKDGEYGYLWELGKGLFISWELGN